MKLHVLLLSLCLCSAGFAAPLEVRLQPEEYVYAYDVMTMYNLRSVMIHDIAVLNPGPGSCTVESVEVKAMRASQPLLTLFISKNDLDIAANRCAKKSENGSLKLYDCAYRTSRYLPPHVTFSASRTLGPNCAVLMGFKPIIFFEAVDQIIVTARGTADGKPVEAKAALKVKSYEQSNDYHFPVSGTWFIDNGASLGTPHRWVPMEEFALDLVMIGSNGILHSGYGSKLAEFYCYKREVKAIGDGIVVAAKNDVPESDSNLQQPGESFESFFKRVIPLQNKLLASGYMEPLGNYVVIRHAGNEYSEYCHLSTGSVKVKPGDAIKRGQVIGQVGHSGNSTEPHLHFQVTDGPDPMYSRGIPVSFSDLIVEDGGEEGQPLQAGWIVTTKQ